MTTNYAIVGKSVPRKGLVEKLTGEARYTADMKMPGMLQGRIVRSPHPHADVLAVDTSAAASLPGVYATVTPFDAPRGHIAADLPVLDTRVRFVGDEVAAVAADDADTAAAALDLIRVEYRTLPFVVDPEEALQPGAPQLYPDGNLATGRPLVLERGDVAQGFTEADLILEDVFRTPGHSPSPLEPRAVLASWEGERLTVWKCTRGVHQDRAALASALEIDPENIRVVGPPLGAGYGAKDETRLAALAAVLAQRAGRPVRLELGRDEEFVAGRVRHAAVLRMKVGLKSEGTVTAVDCSAVLDTGAYLASGPGVLRRTAQAGLYLYTCANVHYEGRLAYTNRPAAGSYRGLGAPQGHFALESLIDRGAEQLGIDPLDLRLRHHVRIEGQPGTRVTPSGDIIDTQPVEGGIPFSSNGLEECLRRGAGAIAWRANRRLPNSSPGSKKRGLGMSMLIYRGGPGGQSSAQVRLNRDGRIELVTGLMDVGEGATTALAQMTAESLGGAFEDVVPVFADTATTPRAPNTAGSTATFSTGTAIVQAASQIRARLLEAASLAMDVPIGVLDIRHGLVYLEADPLRNMTLAEILQSAGEDSMYAEATVTPGSPEYIINTFGAHFAEVEVDTDTGRIRVLRYVAAHDSGQIINPNLAINQVEGGVSQMLGFTLSEDLLSDGPTGVTLNPSFLEHKSPTIMDYPDIRVIFADVVDPVAPLGAKALGEPPCVGVAPAIANAIYNAIGIRFNRLPITPDQVLNALRQRSEAS